MAQEGSSTATTSNSRPLVVDIHTHVYPPSYIKLLQSRSSIPYIRSFPTSSTSSRGEDLRLVILPAEDTESTSRGRPIGPEYHDITRKMAFMKAHGIDISVISLANPWLDFLPPATAAAVAADINREMDELCAQHPGRLFFFATLPLSASVPSITAAIAQLRCLPRARGVILGTTGLGAGLDDPRLEPIWEALAGGGGAAAEESATLPVFLHPHYGLPSSVWGPRASDYGHVLPLALGFPLETTIAITRLLLAGVLERVPRLRLLLAHSGGTLPFLAGRIESCIEHDAHLQARGRLGSARQTVWEALRSNIYLDAVIYDKVGLQAAVEAAGSDRVMFGTDHPFFPPLGGGAGDEGQEDEWASVASNVRAVRESLGEGEEMEAVMGGNAVRVLNLA
ncbi:MAG: hypothetical protein M1818_002604 [Claussenomyces sp. TS43310]|nr:MAG: hypothetical protein M1818_002604 [Claussenomyces sp. TS43310]